MANIPIGNPGRLKATGAGTEADPWIPEVAGAVTVSGGATAANQTTQITAEQAIQATAGATTGAAVITDANGTIQQYLRGLVKLAITAGSFLVTATLAAGSAIIGTVGIDQTTPGTTDAVTAKGLGKTVSVDKTRPADTNVYAAGDVIADATSGGVSVLTFTSVARATGGSGYIMGGVLISSASPATHLDAELWLFDTAIAAGNDNAAFAPTDAEMKTLIGVMEFAVGKVKVGLASGNDMWHGRKNGEPWTPEFFTTVGSANLHGYLVVRNAYTPISAEVFTVRLKIAQVT